MMMTKKKKKHRGWPGPKQAPLVFMAPCKVCGLDHPWPMEFAPGGSIKRERQVRICQRCLLADLARVMRECPERFHQLPTIRALRDQPPAVVWGRSGDAEAAAENKKLGGGLTG